MYHPPIGQFMHPIGLGDPSIGKFSSSIGIDDPPIGNFVAPIGLYPLPLSNFSASTGNIYLIKAHLMKVIGKISTSMNCFSISIDIFNISTSLIKCFISILESSHTIEERVWLACNLYSQNQNPANGSDFGFLHIACNCLIIVLLFKPIS